MQHCLDGGEDAGRAGRVFFPAPSARNSTTHPLMTSEHVALVLQVALFGEVSPALRAVGFNLRDRRVTLVFYYDGPISEEDQESASCMETEMIAALPQDAQVVSEVIRFDAPGRMPPPDRWVYSRRE
jgi:hypothetical protein